MAIAFNLPSEREVTEENFSRLNRLLTELYDVLCQILVSRPPAQGAQANRRDRLHSDFDIERPPFIEPCRRSASAPPITMRDSDYEDDDVFVSPRTDNGSDPFSTRNLDIFGYGSSRTPAGILLSSRSSTSTFTFPVSSDKHWRDKGGTQGTEEPATTDVTDAASSVESTASKSTSKKSILTSIPRKISGSICTAIILMLSWKLWSHKR